MRALYVPWELALHEQDRLFDDLRAWTKIDTIMLLDLYSARLKTGTHGVTYHNSQVALPPTARFSSPVRIMSSEDFAGLAGFMREARSRGFKIASLIEKHGDELAIIECRKKVRRLAGLEFWITHRRRPMLAASPQVPP